MEADVKLHLLDLPALDQETLAAYDQLTEEQYRCCLRSKDPWGVEFTQIIAIGAIKDTNPIGLAIVGFREALGTVQLHSVYVAEPYRRQGIGTRLFEDMIQEVKRRKGRIATFIYQSEQPTSIAYEKILKKLGWTDPLPFMTRLIFDGFAFNPPWIQQKYAFPKGFEIFPWSKLKPDERERLEHLVESKAISYIIDPFHHEDTIEHINSLGLRYGGEVVGWMITHRIAPDTIDYASLYVRPEYKYLGHSIKLLVESIHLQKKSTVKWACFDINLEMTDRRYIEFVRRRLLPHADIVKRFKQSALSLKKQ